jgi:hypothetical protein
MGWCEFADLRRVARRPRLGAGGYPTRSIRLALFAAGISLSLAPRPIAAQTAPPPLILRLPASVRTAGLAGAGTAVVGFAGSVFVNPSGIATIGSLSAEGAYTRHPDRSTHVTGAVAVRLGQFDFGVGYGRLRLRDTATVRANDLWIGSVVYRFGLTAFGASVKYVSVKDSAGAVSESVTSAAGVTVAVFDIAALALSVQNLGRDALSGAPLTLPTTTHLGFTLNFVDPQSTIRLLGTVEAIWTEGESSRTVWGLETGVVLAGVGVAGRLGHGGQPVGSGLSKWAYGAGLELGRFHLDWAHQSESIFGGGVHRFGARWTP